MPRTHPPMHQNTGAASSNWRGPGAALPRWRMSSNRRLRRSVSGSDGPAWMKDCAATGTSST
jgi:hypothetical protein